MSCGCSNSSLLPVGPPGPRGPAGPAGSGLEITDILWSELDALKTANNMSLGYYRITDYATTGTIPNTASTLTGATEPIIVLALNSNTLYHLAWSESNPDDIIHYELNDSTTQNATKGRIYYRKDTIKNLSAGYDWREWEFRRWETSLGSGIFTEFTDPGGGVAYQDFKTFNDSQTGSTCSGIEIKPIVEEDVLNSTAPSDYLNNIIIGSDSFDIKFENSCWNINLETLAKFITFTPTINNIDFTGATHVYAGYDCIIFKNAAFQQYLSFYDGGNSLNVVLPTA